MPQLPVILTAFANSYDAEYLAHLEQEHDRLQQILAPLTYLRHVPLSSAKTGQLVSTLTQYQQELLIFHFGGHADGEQLRFRDAGGQVAGLVEQFGLHPQLKLLFLNGCNTQGQVRQYLETSIPAVIATTCSVEDGQARLFAELFYQALAYGHTLQEAFTRAKGAMKLTDRAVQGEEIVNLRDARLRQEPETEVPWRLYVAGDEVLDWKLAEAATKDSGSNTLLIGGLGNIGIQHVSNSQIIIGGEAKEKRTHFLTLDHHRGNSPVIGRVAELQQLETRLQAAEGNPVVIWGSSGIGKTLLAELYWEKHKLSFDAVGWMNYQTSFIYTLLSELKPEHADYLDLDQAAEDNLKWYADKYILHELQNRPGRKLLVLNNVTANADVAAHLPALNIPDLFLLITAKEKLDSTQAYALPTLNDVEIIELFTTLSGQTADATTQELLAQLGQNALLTKLIARNVPHDDLRAAKGLILDLIAALVENCIFRSI